MADKILVDTNILLYAYDRGEPAKQPLALAVLNSLVLDDLGALTPQILAEFFVNATKKLQPPLTIKETLSSIENYLLSWEIFDMTGAIVSRGHPGRPHLPDALLGCTDLGIGASEPDSGRAQRRLWRWNPSKE